MTPLTLTFDLPAAIANGLADGSLIRYGGVIKNASGQIVMWLRDYGTTEMISSGGIPMIPSVDPITGSLNLIMQGINSGISLRGFAGVTHQLNQIQGLLSVATAASMLSLGVSVMGFVVISKKIKALEGRLQEAQVYLEKIDNKLDLSFYANFRAALDLATNAFTMSKGDNRRSSALNAINRFLEAEHVYTDFLDKELERSSQICDEYLLTLCLAYISEARCYLELEEFETAIRRFQEGREQVHTRLEKYIDLLLTENPSMYLHPSLKGEVSLSRLTKIYQWKDSSLDESSVFDLVRSGFVPESGVWDSHFDDWSESLPASIIEKTDVKKGFWGVKKEGRTEILQKLPEAISEMESMIETSQRFAGYEIEARAISQLGLSFHEWISLKPTETPEEHGNLVFIVPEEPLTLVAA